EISEVTADEKAVLVETLGGEGLGFPIATGHTASANSNPADLADGEICAVVAGDPDRHAVLWPTDRAELDLHRIIRFGARDGRGFGHRISDDQWHPDQVPDARDECGRRRRTTDHTDAQVREGRAVEIR